MPHDTDCIDHHDEGKPMLTRIVFWTVLLGASAFLLVLWLDLAWGDPWPWSLG